MKKSFRILDELSKAEVHLGNPCEKIPHSISDLECDPRVYFNGKASLAQCWVVLMFVWPSILLTDSIGTPCCNVTVVANVCRAI